MRTGFDLLRSFSTALVFGSGLALSASAQDLASGFRSEGELIGDMIDEQVRFVAIYYEDRDRHSLRAGRIFGQPQVSVIASSINEDGKPGRPMMVLSFDPEAPGENPTYIIGEARLIDEGGRDAPLLARSEDADAVLWDFNLSPDGRITAELTLQFRRYARNDDGDLVLSNGNEIETTFMGIFTGQLAEKYVASLD